MTEGMRVNGCKWIERESIPINASPESSRFVLALYSAQQVRTWTDLVSNQGDARGGGSCQRHQHGVEAFALPWSEYNNARKLQIAITMPKYIHTYSD